MCYCFSNWYLIFVMLIFHVFSYYHLLFPNVIHKFFSSTYWYYIVIKNYLISNEQPHIYFFSCHRKNDQLFCGRSPSLRSIKFFFSQISILLVRKIIETKWPRMCSHLVFNKKNQCLHLFPYLTKIIRTTKKSLNDVGTPNSQNQDEININNYIENK